MVEIVKTISTIRFWNYSFSLKTSYVKSSEIFDGAGEASLEESEVINRILPNGESVIDVSSLKKYYNMQILYGVKKDI